MCRNSYGRYRPGTIYLIRQVEGMFPWIVVIREISWYMMYRHIGYPCISQYHISHLIRCISRPRYHSLILLVSRLDLCRCYKTHHHSYEYQYICRIEIKTKIWHIHHLFLSCIYYLFRLHYPIVYAISRQHIWTILHVNFIFRDTDNYIITQNPMVGAAVTTAASVEEAANYSLNLCYFPRSSFTLFCTLSYS